MCLWISVCKTVWGVLKNGVEDEWSPWIELSVSFVRRYPKTIDREGKQSFWWEDGLLMVNTHLDMKTENGDVVNFYADLKQSGVRTMIILGCEKNSSASEDSERRSFFVNRSSNQKW